MLLTQDLMWSLEQSSALQLIVQYNVKLICYFVL